VLVNALFKLALGRRVAYLKTFGKIRPMYILVTVKTFQFTFALQSPNIT